ncbi:hypothetical protein [Hahella ganghwensis]|uniref:hypothetical protein n=1 Tax=Hahella ganghwensis TaxID=286420 RepID=UPI0003613054|nr:hypothetical protein [Hahella ganghwensis]
MDTTLTAVILIASVALVLSGIGLFFGGMLANSSGEARATGIHVNFSPQTAVLLLAGVGLYFLPKTAVDPISSFEQLPAPAAGISAESSYSGGTLPEIGGLEAWLLDTSGAFRLEVFSLGDRQYDLVGSMDLFPLGNHQYQMFLDIHPEGSSSLNDSLIGSGRLYLESEQWYLLFEEGSPAVEITGQAIPVTLERQENFLVLQFKDSADRTYRQTWRQL